MHISKYTTDHEQERMQPLNHDHQLRAVLKEHLAPRVGERDLLVDELLLAWGAVRADVALVNGTLEAFEIKAGGDTLKRLPAQVEAYNAVFEFAWLVTTAEHLKEARALLPTWWGILVAKEAQDSVSMVCARGAKPNKRRQVEHMVRLLWRDEVLAKLEELGLAKGLKSKPKLVLFQHLAAAMSVEELDAYVRECLKARTDWRT